MKFKFGWFCGGVKIVVFFIISFFVEDLVFLENFMNKFFWYFILGYLKVGRVGIVCCYFRWG